MLFQYRNMMFTYWLFQQCSNTKQFISPPPYNIGYVLICHSNAIKFACFTVEIKVKAFLEGQLFFLLLRVYFSF